ncbi:hypothetical protein [Staphylococcus lutrae]|uniref:Uncharacterized protein n=1 Tax=Staphylococcus lutrae TaxID=155085 RepID=A0AAC9RTW5_9STAP|nr:hypothetical protein [Staphylococcus lutrae]ARJ50620.1 hypothetical protein B5P37_04450 [Staphylococcus lutrae]PNZ38807.1 hypothetical protein CD134_03235 [Staphylococcus lutrae]
MVNTLVITDGHPYTHNYVEQLRSEGHQVYVQASPTVRQTTSAPTREIDLYDLSHVVTALKDIALVVIIGTPQFSNTRLTQSHPQQLQQVMYDNLGFGMKQANIQKCMVLQATLQPVLKQTMDAYQIKIVHQSLKKASGYIGRCACYQWSRERHSVRSIQAFNVPKNISMDAVTAMYGRFLKTLNGRLINGVYDGRRFTIVLMPFKIPLIQMHDHPDSDPMRHVILNITGGWLVQQSGRTARFELRRLAGDTTQCLIALHDFVPRLPWGIYRVTQAPLHRAVSILFRRYWQHFNNKAMDD